MSNYALQELCNDKTKMSDQQSNENLNMIAWTYTPDESQKFIPEFLSIIDQVFTIDSPKATQKIGLTYLAEIIKQFPDLCDRYMEIILSV